MRDHHKPPLHFLGLHLKWYRLWYPDLNVARSLLFVFSTEHRKQDVSGLHIGLASISIQRDLSIDCQICKFYHSRVFPPGLVDIRKQTLLFDSQQMRGRDTTTQFLNARSFGYWVLTLFAICHYYTGDMHSHCNEV
jgi:hypothetical protein